MSSFPFSNTPCAIPILLGGLLSLATILPAPAAPVDEKKLALGIVARMEKDRIVIRKAGKEDEEEFPLDQAPVFHFVGFKGIGQSPETPQVGFGMKASVAADGTIKQMLFSPPIPPLKKIPDRHKLSAVELFRIADQNKDGTVNYVEYATWIFQSNKHLPDRYLTKLDKNGDDVLDAPEFTSSLNELAWWVMSRKTAEEWVRFADTDKSGGLNREEAMTVTHGAHGKHDKVVAKLDRDKSGELSSSELQAYCDAIISKKDAEE